jgi:hypothetical protein
VRNFKQENKFIADPDPNRAQDPRFNYGSGPEIKIIPDPDPQAKRNYLPT